MCPVGCSVITCHLTIIYCTNFSTVATLWMSCLRHIFHLGQILCIFEGESWECIKFISHNHKHFIPNPGLLSGKFTLSEIQLWPVTGAGGFLKHGVTLSLIKSSSHCHQVITWVGLLTHDALRVTHSSLSLSVGKVTNLSRSQFLVPGDRCGPFKRIMGTWWLVNDTVKHHSASTYSQFWKKRRREN